MRPKFGKQVHLEGSGDVISSRSRDKLKTFNLSVTQYLCPQNWQDVD